MIDEFIVTAHESIRHVDSVDGFPVPVSVSGPDGG